METEQLRNSIIEKLKVLNDIEPLSYLLESLQGEYAVLSLIADRKFVTPTEISNAINISKSRSTAILNTLRKKGFVNVTKGKKDKRKLIVSLNDLGADALLIKKTHAETLFDEYLTELGDEYAQKLIDFLDKSVEIAKNKLNNKL